MRDRFRNRLLTLVTVTGCLAALGGGTAGASTAGAAGASGGWTIQSTYRPPLGSRQPIGLDVVSCAADGTCMALGRASSPFLSEAWNGTTWQHQHFAAPAGAAGLDGVSCTATAECTAVGFTPDAILAERWNGANWQQQTVPAPSGGTAPGLQGVSCPAAGSCIAVGSYEVNGQSAQTSQIADTWNGTDWSPQAMPSTGYKRSQLNSVSCPTATGCVAVGYTTNNILKQEYALAEMWNGTNWTIQKTAALPGSAEASLSQVTCPAANSCTAIGSYLKNRTPVTLIEHWNGTRWAIQSGLPADVELYSLSCPSTTSCTAVGFDSGIKLPVAVHWNGTTWTIESLPKPPHTMGDLVLREVSCPTTSRCVGVGQYRLAQTATHPSEQATLIEGN